MKLIHSLYKYLFEDKKYPINCIEKIQLIKTGFFDTRIFTNFDRECFEIYGEPQQLPIKYTRTLLKGEPTALTIPVWLSLDQCAAYFFDLSPKNKAYVIYECSHKQSTTAQHIFINTNSVDKNQIQKFLNIHAVHELIGPFRWNTIHITEEMKNGN